MPLIRFPQDRVPLHTKQSDGANAGDIFAISLIDLSGLYAYSKVLSPWPEWIRLRTLDVEFNVSI